MKSTLTHTLHPSMNRREITWPPDHKLFKKSEILDFLKPSSFSQTSPPATSNPPIHTNSIDQYQHSQSTTSAHTTHHHETPHQPRSPWPGPCWISSCQERLRMYHNPHSDMSIRYKRLGMNRCKANNTNKFNSAFRAAALACLRSAMEVTARISS